jgi:hypothetical protein
LESGQPSRLNLQLLPTSTQCIQKSYLDFWKKCTNISKEAFAFATYKMQVVTSYKKLVTL